MQHKVEVTPDTGLKLDSINLQPGNCSPAPCKM